HIGDVVERAQMLHHGLTDHLGGDLGLAAGLELADDGGDHLLDPLRLSLPLSNGPRRPLRLITVSSRNCTRSKVVKRKLQATHTRRLRITEESSVGRESFTCVSRLLQLGQRIQQDLYW